MRKHDQLIEANSNRLGKKSDAFAHPLGFAVRAACSSLWLERENEASLRRGSESGPLPPPPVWRWRACRRARRRSTTARLFPEREEDLGQGFKLSCGQARGGLDQTRHAQNALQIHALVLPESRHPGYFR